MRVPVIQLTLNKFTSFDLSEYCFIASVANPNDGDEVLVTSFPIIILSKNLSLSKNIQNILEL